MGRRPERDYEAHVKLVETSDYALRLARVLRILQQIKRRLEAEARRGGDDDGSAQGENDDATR